MKYIKYLTFTAAIELPIYCIVFLLSSPKYATAVTAALFPVALWSGRLITAYQLGAITRRMKMLDGGPPCAGLFWSFRPETYVRKPGFDNFKGYFIKEAACCFLVWLLFLGPIVINILERINP